MRIRKQYQVIPTNAKLENGDSTSATNGYTAEYINNHSVVVSAVEPSGSARKKVWLRHSKNLFNINNHIAKANIETNGEIINADPFDIYYVKLESGKTYTMSTGSSRMWVYNFFTTVPHIGSTGSTRNVNTSINETFTVPNGYSYIALRKYDNNGEVITNLMLNEGSTALPYENVQDTPYILDDDNVYREYAPQNEIYSESEIRIGTWMGKPLYRKCYTGTTGTTDGVDLPTSNLDKLVNEGGYIAYTSSLLFPIPSTFGTDGANDIRVIKSSNSTLKIQHGSNLKSKGYELFVEYTKTTDD